MHAPFPSASAGAACAIALSTIALAFSSSVRSHDELADAAGHERMVRALALVASTSEATNPYLSSSELEKLREADQAGELASDLISTVSSYMHLGRLELRVGEPDRAVLAFQRARDEVTSSSASYPRLELKIVYELALANLRAGENANCIARHTSESCILPITGDGVHAEQSGSRAAMGLLEEILDSPHTGEDMRLACRWLLSLAAMTVGEYPDGVDLDDAVPPKAFESDAEIARFVDVAPGLGINSFDLAGGALVEDYDGDGVLDLFASTWSTTGELSYFAADGEGGFDARTEAAGLQGLTGGLNLVQADYDNDGDVDVLVLRGAWLGADGAHPNSLLRNDGGSFTDVTFPAGLAENSHPTQAAAWADYDLDGDLDLYVGNESSPLAPHRSQLFRNEGDGTFVEVTETAGVSNMRMAKGVSWGDYDDDGDPDLYVSNLGGWNRLYRNDGDGTFTDVASRLEILQPYDSFATWFWDYDNDGDLDLYVASFHQSSGNSNHDAFRLLPTVASFLGVDYGAERAALYENDGSGNFRDVARQRGLDAVSLTMGANFGDLDNDGFHDFYLGTGYPYYDGLVPNVMYRSRGGTTFEDVTTSGGFGHLQKGHGIVFADVDGDGDQDVFQQVGGAYPGDAFGNVLYENPGTANHWVRLRLVGKRSNSRGIGARVAVHLTTSDGSKRVVHRVMGETGSFGGNPLHLHVGLGDAERVDRLEVRWPASGSVQSFEDVPADREVVVQEDASELTTSVVKRVAFRK